MLGALKDIPRLAIATVIVGLLVTAAAHYLVNLDLETGERLAYEEVIDLPDSRPAKLGSGGRIAIEDAQIQATRANASDYRIYRVAAHLDITTGDPEGRATAVCQTKVPDGVIFAHTGNARAAYPRPSEDLQLQNVPSLSVVKFAVKGTDAVGLEIEDAIEAYSTPADVIVEWSEFRSGNQGYEWVLKGTGREEPVRLSFATLFRTTGDPAAPITCEARVGDGKAARTKTRGSLG